ncbi:hypothetical protein MalM25_22140 [Planctomycetes bacterium MalM25]|nr:hypothetical protein MalM25_22140 [Planctomycetes bacterium MalM25]
MFGTTQSHRYHGDFCSAVMAALLLAAIGCNNSKFEFAEVQGSVTLDGQPVPEAKVVYMPVASNDDGEAGPYSQGVTDAEGRYTLKSVEPSPHKGAVVGQHKIVVSTKRAHLDPDKLDVEIIDSPETIPRQYTYYKRTPLTFEVPSGGTEIADFQLTSSRR